MTAARRRGDRIVVSDIPLLFEADDPAGFDAIVLVDAPEPVRRARLAQRGLPAGEAERLMAAQQPAAGKRARSDYVIDNDGRPRHARARGARGLGRRSSHALDLDPAPAYPPTRHHATGVTVSNVPDDLRYTPEHEYIARTGDPAVVRIGITDYAQGELGDVVFVNLPKRGDTLTGHQAFGTIEAVKAVSELYSPVAGDGRRRSTRALDADPAVVNRDPYGEGWMITLRLVESSRPRRAAVARRLPLPHRGIARVPESSCSGASSRPTLRRSPDAPRACPRGIFLTTFVRSQGLRFR